MVARRLMTPYEGAARSIYRILNPESLVEWVDLDEQTKEWYRQSIMRAIQST